jgi:23S rRNA pseudouridine955/2504/2580 synthase
MAESIEISRTEDGTRLLRWFLRHFPGMPQGEFYKLCRGGQIRINSTRARGTEILHVGDHIRIPPTITKYKTEKIKKTESGEKFSLGDLEELRRCIIHDDDDLVAFNKPAGMAVQGGTGIRKSIDKMTAALYPDAKISLVHRLDRETSGILIVAKTQNAAQKLAREFQDKTARKEYLALLVGNVSPMGGTIDNMIIRSRVLDADETAPDGTHPQRAITDYRVLGNVSGVLSWVQFSPRTGRTHQLRLHSAYTLHAPILGDTLYGRPAKLDPALDSVVSTKNLFLFAHKISFTHPTSGKIITLRAELPEFMRPVIRFLEFKIPD